MMFFLHIFINVLILGLFLYSKLLPYKDRLDNRYKSVFNFFNSVLTPLLNLLKKVFNPFKVGQGLSVDMTQIILLVVFLILLNITR